MFRRIVVVCLGNICRSPMAEALLKNNFMNKDNQIEISSAGIAALVNYPADKVAQELMLKKGIDISSHRARQLTPKILSDSDLILVMESNHQHEIEKMAPNMRGRIHRLGKWSGFDIPDPYRRAKLIFEQSLALIEQGIDEWQNKLWK